MINNRQNGRRRGRGGQQQPRGISGRPDGNRQDNRQRGNAAQLLEKYKALARDTQLAGDRVQTEYYLQFAEHYFRILGESQARFDEQRRARGDDVDDGYDGYGDESDGEMDSDDDGQQDRSPQHAPNRQYEDRGDRQPQQQRTERYERNDRSPQRDQRPQRDDRPQQLRGERNDRPAQRDEPLPERAESADRIERPARAERPNGRVRRDRDEEPDEQRIAFDVIPPAIGPVEEVVAEAQAEEPARPRRRVRRPRPEGDIEVAPAA